MTRRRYRSIPALLVLGSLLASCGGGGGGGGVTPQNTPTPTPGGYSEQAFQCPSSETSLNGIHRAIATSNAITRRRPNRGKVAASNTLLAVSYATGAGMSSALDARIATLGAHTIHDQAFSYIGRSLRVVHVSPSSLAATQSALRALPGVRDVSPVRYLNAQTVAGPYFNQDPFFAGVSGSVAPLYQTSSAGGQWDMNIIGLGYAFDYSQAANGSGIVNNNALGSRSVKLAIIDSGEDVTNADLSGATVAETKCFLTDPTGNASTSNYVTDGLGHGTDVTGIAAASSSTPNVGFAGTSGNVSLMLYRVFPTPDDNCASPDSSAAQHDQQCGAADIDIANAITDAIANGAKVINMSLGQSQTPCTNGADPDKAEGDAVANAIAAGIIVVASSGNDSTAGQNFTPDAPACDPGVIAVGASAYNDGQSNGSGYSGANVEYVANYSNVGSGDTAHSASSWGIVAPGGDPISDTDSDSLHWVENLWTSTPYQSSPSDTDYEGSCGPNVGDGFSQTFCRTEIAGTSMASPHVAGAAALILSVSGSTYASPTAMRALLCQTADDISDPNQGCGRLNVYNAMAVALKDPNPPTPVP